MSLFKQTPAKTLFLGVTVAILLAVLGYYISSNQQCPVRYNEIQSQTTACEDGVNLSVIYTWGFAIFILILTLFNYYLSKRYKK